MRSSAVLAVLLVAGPLAAQAVPPTRVTLDGPKTAAELVALVEKLSGIKVQATAVEATIGPAKDKTFWELLESLAAKTDARLVVNGASKSIAFAKGKARTAASLDGAFRVAANGVTAKLDAVTGETTYTLALDAHWEPRFPVYRIDTHPRVAGAKDDLGNTLTVRTASVKGAVHGYSHVSEMRIEGLTRKATSIASIAGEFTVTAAPKMLAFEFDDLATLPATKTIDGVKATLTKILKRDEVWELQLTVEYPADPPSFESFESWTNRNAIRLVAPTGRLVADTDNWDAGATGRTVRAAYRYAFKSADLSNRTGWKVVYESPAPLVEFPVKFQLKDIPLP